MQSLLVCLRLLAGIIVATCPLLAQESFLAVQNLARSLPVYGMSPNIGLDSNHNFLSLQFGLDRSLASLRTSSTEELDAVKVPVGCPVFIGYPVPEERSLAKAPKAFFDPSIQVTSTMLEQDWRGLQNSVATYQKTDYSCQFFLVGLPQVTGERAADVATRLQLSATDQSTQYVFLVQDDLLELSSTSPTQVTLYRIQLPELGIGNIAADESFPIRVVPNPVVGGFRLELTTPVGIDRVIALRAIDALGRSIDLPIEQQERDAADNFIQLASRAQQLADGMYQLQVTLQHTDGTYTTRTIPLLRQ